jgi:outer membrane protein assembly factor BamB
VYIPLTAPTSAAYGGWRPGDNLYSNALVALDAKTGRRVWHFQMVHHDLWDFDNNAAPQLTTIRHNGRNRDVVAVAGKTGWLYVFDRVTGEPMWRVIRPTDAPAESPDAYTTPALVQVGGKTQFVITGGDYVTGHDPSTGVELWRTPGLNPNKARDYRIISSAVVVGDMIFAPTSAINGSGTVNVRVHVIESFCKIACEFQVLLLIFTTPPQLNASPEQPLAVVVAGGSRRPFSKDTAAPSTGCDVPPTRSDTLPHTDVPMIHG